MTDLPDELMDSEGKWAKRRNFVDEMVEETGESRERIDDILQEMIDGNAPMRSKKIGDTEYVQLRSQTEAISYWLKKKTSNKIGNLKGRFLDG